MEETEKTEFLKECNVEDLLQHDALDLWKKLELSSEVSLAISDNKKRIAVVMEEKVIGLLSESDSTSLLPYVQMGHSNVYKCQVSFKSDEKSDGLKLKVCIKVKAE